MIYQRDDYEKALEEELKRVNELDDLAMHLLDQCERQASALATVSTRLSELQRGDEGMNCTVEVGEIQDVLKVLFVYLY